MPCHSERGAHSCSSSPRNLGSTRISFWKRERERERERESAERSERKGRETQDAPGDESQNYELFVLLREIVQILVLQVSVLPAENRVLRWGVSFRVDGRALLRFQVAPASEKHTSERVSRSVSVGKGSLLHALWPLLTFSGRIRRSKAGRRQSPPCGASACTPGTLSR